jgi:hypothetical protein
MALLSFVGFDTPSLQAQGEQRRSSISTSTGAIPWKGIIPRRLSLLKPVWVRVSGRPAELRLGQGRPYPSAPLALPIPGMARNQTRHGGGMAGPLCATNRHMQRNIIVASRTSSVRSRGLGGLRQIGADLCQQFAWTIGLADIAVTTCRKGLFLIPGQGIGRYGYNRYRL